MNDRLSIEGFAIVSRDGKLAGADGKFSPALCFDVDHQLLDEELDRASLLIHGRNSHEGQNNSHKRKRLLVTRSGGPFTTTPIAPNTWLWSPQATKFSDVCKTLGVETGLVAVLGGTAVYDLFLPVFDKFHLSRAEKVELPGGVPVFGAVGEGYSLDAALERAGLAHAKEVTLHADHELRHETWTRPVAR